MSTCRCHYPGGIVGSDRSWDGLFHPFPCSPTTAAFPDYHGGSAPTLNLSRPAQHSLALRPVDSLHRRAVHLSRRLRRLCYLRRRSDSFRPERPSWPGGTCTRWEDTALSRRTKYTILQNHSEDSTQTNATKWFSLRLNAIRVSALKLAAAPCKTLRLMPIRVSALKLAAAPCKTRTAGL